MTEKTIFSGFTFTGSKYTEIYDLLNIALSNIGFECENMSISHLKNGYELISQP